MLNKPTVRPEPVEGRRLAVRSWFDKLTTNGLNGLLQDRLAAYGDRDFGGSGFNRDRRTAAR